ncbi:MAG: hypothetical protein U5K69_20415 [Balneolaceae bacterium]|nr:hypothetical protein [Balneolaceae bacterium]
MLESPAGMSTSLPYLTTDSSGNLYMSWVEQQPEGMAILNYARYSDGTWTEPEPLASGSDWFVNWADYPSIVAAQSELIAAHWLHKVPGNAYSYEVNLAAIGGTQDTVLTPHFDKTATEHGFVSMIPWAERSMLAVWLDGRQTADRAEDEYGDLSKAMSIRSAVIHQDGSVTDRKQIDGSVCDCCQTSLARTSTGAIAAYRNRTEDEIRDIQVSRFIKGEWSEPVLVHNDNWKIGGCPVNGPVIKSNGETVLVAWFTGAQEQNQVKAAFSTDGGATFGDPVKIDMGDAIGRLDAALINPNTAIISWMENGEKEALLNIRAVTRGKKLPGKAVTITHMSKDRKSGFPQLAVHNNWLFFAWTAVGDQTQIKMASLPLESVVNF